MVRIEKAKTIQEQTGHVRQSDVSLLQDTQLLQSMYEYDYDITDKEFREYISARLGLLSNMTQESIDFYQTYSELDIYEHCKKFRENLVGSAKPDNIEKAIEADMKVVKIMKAKIQDCWEIYQDYPNIYNLFDKDKVVEDKLVPAIATENIDTGNVVKVKEEEEVFGDPEEYTDEETF